MSLIKIQAIFLHLVTARSPRIRLIRNALLYLFVILLCLILSYLPGAREAPLAGLQRFAFDSQMALLRKYHPRPAAVEPVLIGIDESTIAQFPEPTALWHHHYARTLEALTRAMPAAVGVDIVLPERSYDNILPGVQIELIRSLFSIKQVISVAFVRSINADTPIHPSYVRVLGEENFATDQVLTDPDAVSRAFSEPSVQRSTGDPAPAFAARLARAMGKAVGEGWIDYSRGELLHYIPMQDVIGWLDNDNDLELKRHFQGKVVLIGFVVKDIDRRKTSVPLLWETSRKINYVDDQDQPGVMVHLQSLRSLLGSGLIAPLPYWLDWLGVLILASLVWLRSSFRLLLMGGLLAPIGLSVFSLMAMQANGLLPLALWLAALLIALGARALIDGLETGIEKKRLKQSFSGSVSPAVLQEILNGDLEAGAAAQTMQVCVLFSDIRGFTTLSEALSPEIVTGVLTRYFDRMVTVAHRYEGTIDKFIGDGMMVLFGAPRPLPNACRSAVMCALDMAFALEDLNKEFKEDGLPHFGFGVGINYGSAVVGNIGSSQRHNYSAIGDVVNVAARLEGLTRGLGFQVVMTEQVKLQLTGFEPEFELVNCGKPDIKGHTPVQVWGLAIEAESNNSSESDGEKP